MATLYSCFDFNPRSPHGERRIVLWMLFTLQKFQSTLPARGATAAKPIHDQMVVFQSTLPARGATCRSKKILLQRWIFQSTLPARGATGAGAEYGRGQGISIHAPRTGSDFKPCVEFFYIIISIHAPRTGSDEDAKRVLEVLVGISIHAPRTGSDRFDAGQDAPLDLNFNPRSPHGERLLSAAAKHRHENFNPRSPHGERHPDL